MARELGRRLRSWEGLLLVVLLVVLAYNVTRVPNFLTVSNQVNLFQLGIEKAIVVLIMTFVIISGEIDLSVASMMGLSAAVTACPLRIRGAHAAGDPGGARRRRGIRSPQRLLRRGRGIELAGSHPGGIHRIPGSGETCSSRTVPSAGSPTGSPTWGSMVWSDH